MTEINYSLTGFDLAGGDRHGQSGRPEPRIRVNGRAAGALAMGKSRLVVMMAAFTVGFGAVGAKLVDATVSFGGAKEPSVARAAARTMPQVRADIVDRNGVLLATSLHTASLFADPKLILDANEAVQHLTRVLPELDPVALMADLKSDKRFVWIKRNLSPRQQQEIFRLGIPGLNFQREERRVYPQGNLAAHVVGFSGVDNNGLMGIEQAFDTRLKENDEPLRLSIDVRLQHVLRKELVNAVEEFRAIGAAGMVMDVKTGEILGMVSVPDFDPHAPPPPQEEQDTDPRFNRNTLGVYEMGSTFKIFNTAMALESGQVHMNDMFDATRPIRIGRFTISDFHPENKWMDVADVFKHSSNIGSVKMAMEVGPQAQKDFMAKLGFLRQANLEVPERGWPMVPNPWREVNMMTISFGHGMSVSPVHLMAAVGGTVNGGVMHPATLLVRDNVNEIPGTRIISEKTSDQVRKLMRLVVTEGTATKADAAGYLVGGKTGTADKVKGRSYAANARISSFAGAFPMNDPRYAIYVMVDEPKGTKKTFGFATGGWVAAPTVGNIVAQIGPLLGVKPQDANAPEIIQALAIRPPPAPGSGTGAQVAAIPVTMTSGEDRD
ncbi:penicillin-binding protein [Niveispirillum lacus]|uniref:Penicillin-binding protein n=1 Tax=Niveispirillum lacus TaxID=1981099 RepID=A0A255YT93_9PROT|nr:penicillin-binding protein 2 [Niveispirillum lacus]OYQ32401.1 penicillin-binding protein [Niveispirillum lacus]